MNAAETRPSEQSPLVGGAGAEKGGTRASRDFVFTPDFVFTEVFGLFTIIAPALLGNMLEFYEFGIYVLVTPYMTAAFFSDYGDFGSTFGVWFGFSVSFVVRPFGGALFGYIGDRFGRRVSLIISVGGMIVCTAGIGLLPAHALVGLVLLVVFKICQGLFVGGELVTTVVFAVEHAGTELVATAVAISVATAAFGLLAASVVVLLIEYMTTDEQMYAWGWRVPFLLALPWGLLAMLLRSRLKESAVFAEHLKQSEAKPGGADGQPGPMATVWRDYRLPFCLGILCTVGYAAGFWGCVMYPKDFLVDAGVRDVRTAIQCGVIGLLCAMSAQVAAGLLCDAYGILRVCLVASAVVLVGVWPAWCLLVLPGQSWASYVAMPLLGLMSGLQTGVAAATIELFPVHVRATGFGVAWNISQALGAAPAPFVAKAVWASLKERPGAGWLVDSAPALWPTLMVAVSGVALLLLWRAGSQGLLQPTHIRHSPYV